MQQLNCVGYFLTRTLLCVGTVKTRAAQENQQSAAASQSALQDTREEENTLVKSLQAVLKDKSFKIQTPVTIQTRESAVHLLEWCLIKRYKQRNHESICKSTNRATTKCDFILC